MTPSVLVVDDEAEVADWITSHLRRAGCQVWVAVHGRGALREAQNRLPDIILLDMTLPDLDGTSVCELLHCLPSTRHTPVVLITAAGDSISPDQVLRAGACGLLCKPLDAQRLLDQVHHALAAAECDTLVRRVLADESGGDREEDWVEPRNGSTGNPPALVEEAAGRG